MSSSAIRIRTTRPKPRRRCVLALCVLTAACSDEPRSGATDPVEVDDGGALPVDGGAAARDAEGARDGAADGGSPGGDDAATSPDGGDAPTCNPVAQTGCGAGERCDRTPSGLACRPAGTLAPFVRCDPSGPEACIAGTSCADTNFDDARCTPFCDPETLTGCVGPGQTCHRRRLDDPYALCSFVHECSPLRQDCANPAERCAWSLLGAFCVVPSGRVPDGGECASAVSCAAGSTCVDDGVGHTRCFKQCSPVAEPDGCAEDEHCEPYAEVWPDALGVCRRQPQ